MCSKSPARSNSTVLSQQAHTSWHIPETDLDLASMISFSSPPHCPVSPFGVDVSESEDFYMNDDHDFEAEITTITSPGESITSARAFMRLGCPVVPFLFTQSFLGDMALTWIAMKLSHPSLAPLRGSTSSSRSERCGQGTPGLIRS
jgi:hypothetical protein